jgi:hypothetical protein
MSRIEDLRAFYDILDALSVRVGRPRALRDCQGRMRWPQRGVYFFFEPGEVRTTSGSGPRVVRVGTHALKPASRTSLWDRLSQHRGPASSGAGNHRGSVFRELIGEAMIMRRRGTGLASWGVARSARAAAEVLGRPAAHVRSEEHALETEVSTVIGQMPFLWVEIGDEPSPRSLRGFIERNAIALLSNADRMPVDPPSTTWLGMHSRRESVRKSGLWNSNHVTEAYSPAFLEAFALAVG